MLISGPAETHSGLDRLFTGAVIQAATFIRGLAEATHLVRLGGCLPVEPAQHATIGSAVIDAPPVFSVMTSGGYASVRGSDGEPYLADMESGIGETPLRWHFGEQCEWHTAKHYNAVGAGCTYARHVSWLI
jgi:hypothetical protein